MAKVYRKRPAVCPGAGEKKPGNFPDRFSNAPEKIYGRAARLGRAMKSEKFLIAAIASYLLALPLGAKSVAELDKNIAEEKKWAELAKVRAERLKVEIEVAKFEGQLDAARKTAKPTAPPKPTTFDTRDLQGWLALEKVMKETGVRITTTSLPVQHPAKPDVAEVSTTTPAANGTPVKNTPVKNTATETTPTGNATPASTVAASVIADSNAQPGSNDPAPDQAATPTPAATETPATGQVGWLGSRFEAIKVETGSALKGTNWFFHSGLRTIAPYTVDEASALVPSRNQVGGFLEFVYNDVWAWNDVRLNYTQRRTRNALNRLRDDENAWSDNTRWKNNQVHHSFDPDSFHVDWSALFDRSNGFDHLARLSFEFDSKDKASASTITGSGDVSAEFILDKHLVRGWTPRSAYTISTTLSGGIVTDRKAAYAHPRGLLGLTYAVAFVNPLEPKADARQALFRMTLGHGVIDTVRYLDRPSGTLRTVAPGVPRYVRRYTNALETEAYFPLFKQSFVTLGARLYSPADPTPWSLYIGLTTPLTDVVGGFFPK